MAEIENVQSSTEFPAAVEKSAVDRMSSVAESSSSLASWLYPTGLAIIAVIVKVVYNQLPQRPEAHETVFHFAVGVFSIAAVIDRVCNPLIARLPFDMRALAKCSKIPIIFCAIYYGRPYSYITSLVAASALSVLGIYTFLQEKTDPEIALSSIFDEKTVELIENILQWVYEETALVICKDFKWRELASYINLNSPNPKSLNQQEILSLFFSYMRKNWEVAPHVLISVAETIRRETGVEVTYKPSKKTLKPTYLTPIKKKSLPVSWQGHQKQLESARGGLEKKHIFVSGCSSSELKNLVQVTISEDEELLEWEIDQMSKFTTSENTAFRDALIDYLWAHPKTVLYVFSTVQFKHLNFYQINFLLNNFPPTTTLICATSSPEIEDSSNFQALFLERSKRVHLTSLSEQESNEAIKEWIESTTYRNTQFEKHTLAAAVKMAYLLLGEKDGKFELIQDLMERAIKTARDTPVTILHVWQVFTQLYPIEKNRIENTNNIDRLVLLSQGSSIVSLDAIASAINAEFKVALPLQVKPSFSPPFFLENLNEKMRNKPQITVGNERRIAELEGALKGLGKHNALLIGKPGVGKTTLVESIAWMSEQNLIPPGSPLHGKIIYSLDVNEMAKDIQLIGTFEARISKLIGFLRASKSAILFIDELHLILGAGAYQGNEMGTLGQKLKPYLTEEWMTVIGATTPGEADKWMRGQELAAFKRRFKDVLISEPTPEECEKMLKHLTESERFDAIYSGVTFEEGVIAKAIQLTNNRPTSVGQPDRSKDLLERAANVALLRTNKAVTMEDIKLCFQQATAVQARQVGG